MKHAPVEVMNYLPCFSCGGESPEADGPVHTYMASTPGCWAAFGEVLAREYSNPALYAVHRLSVDCYAVQHPGTPSRRSIQSVGLHLARLCLVLERDLPSQHAHAAMLELARGKADFEWLEPPASLGAVTVADVLAVEVDREGGAEEHRRTVRQWAESTWAAWAAHHETVRSRLRR